MQSIPLRPLSQEFTIYLHKLYTIYQLTFHNQIS